MKKKDLIRIVYEKIMLAIGVMIANLVMNETMTVCIVSTVLVVGITLIFDIIQLRNNNDTLETCFFEAGFSISNSFLLLNFYNIFHYSLNIL